MVKPLAQTAYANFLRMSRDKRYSLKLGDHIPLSFYESSSLLMNENIVPDHFKAAIAVYGVADYEEHNVIKSDLT